MCRRPPRAGERSRGATRRRDEDEPSDELAATRRQPGVPRLMAGFQHARSARRSRRRLGALERRTVPWLASPHEPAPEQAHVARSGDAPAARTASARGSQAAAQARRALIAIAAIVAVAVAAGIGSSAAVVAYGSSCDLDSLRSVNIGVELVRLRRERHPARLDPRRAQPRAGDARRTCRSGFARRRSRSRTGGSSSTEESTSRESRARPSPDAQGRADRRGRVDHHAAARPQPLHLATSRPCSGR